MAQTTNNLKLITAAEAGVEVDAYNSNLRIIDTRYNDQTEKINTLQNKLVESRYIFLDPDYNLLKCRNKGTEDKPVYEIYRYSEKIKKEEILSSYDSYSTIVDGTAWQAGDDILVSAFPSTGFDLSAIDTQINKGNLVLKSSKYGDDGGRIVVLSVFPQAFGGYYRLETASNTEMTWVYEASTTNVQPASSITKPLPVNQLKLYYFDAIFNIDSRGFISHTGFPDNDDVSIGETDNYTVSYGTVQDGANEPNAEHKIVIATKPNAISITKSTNRSLMDYVFYIKNGTTLEPVNITHTIKPTTGFNEEMIFYTDAFYWKRLSGKQLICRIRIPDEALVVTENLGDVLTALQTI